MQPSHHRPPDQGRSATSPQWQIEALRRLEIPEDMQRQHGFRPLGPADGQVTRMIFGETSARM